MMHFDDAAYIDDRKWPTKEEPNHFYKFSSWWIEQGPSVTEIERTTYSTLDWIGDVGGLFDGLLIIGRFALGPLASFALRAKVFATLFSYENNTS